MLVTSKFPYPVCPPLNSLIFRSKNHYSRDLVLNILIFGLDEGFYLELLYYFLLGFSFQVY